MTTIDPPELTDGRLVVRPVTEDDVDAVHAACQDPDIQRWTVVPSPYRREHAERFLELSRDALREGTGAHMLVLSAGTGELLGACGVTVNRGDLVGEVGYWTAAHARRRGVASGAVRLVCRWAFHDLGLGRLFLHAAAPNESSNAVARAVGFSLEGTLRRGAILGHTGDPSHPRVDVNVYGLLPEELSG